MVSKFYIQKMTDQEKHLKDIAHIRNMMERSSSFISLSGLSGVITGVVAIIGAYIAYQYLGFFELPSLPSSIVVENGVINYDKVIFLLIDGIAVLGLAIGGALFFTIRNSRRKGLPIWDKTAYHTLINLLIPLTAGGLYSIIMFLQGDLNAIAGITLIFYGLALINASHFTHKEIRVLGLLEILLGLFAAIFRGYDLIFWTLGFGVLHILYGFIMYYKYERYHYKSK